MLLVRAGTRGGGVVGLLAPEQGLGCDDSGGGRWLHTHTHTQMDTHENEAIADVHIRTDGEMSKIGTWGS